MISLLEILMKYKEPLSWNNYLQDLLSFNVANQLESVFTSGQSFEQKF